VIGAENGREALEILDQKAFDLILMDVQMPELDGFEVTRMIRSDDRRRSTPVIGMGTLALIGDRDKCLAAGMDDVLAKPIEADAMFLMIEKWRGHRSGDLPGAAAA
jgi:CheY-like chemotaxis protein